MVYKILRRLGIALFFMLIVFYVVYALFSSRFSAVSTEKVYMSKAAESINTTCLILRKEQTLKSTKDGHISYTVDDGDKVAANNSVARVFSSQNKTTSQLEKDRISQEYDVIKKLQKNLGNLSVGINIVESQISNAIVDYNSAIVSGDYSEMFDLRNNMLYYINERKYLTGEEKSFSERKKELKEKINNMSSVSEGDYVEVSAPKSGVFSSYCDGYEDCFDYRKAENMTLDDFQKIQKKAVDDNTLGRLVTEFDWYILCPVTADQALQLNTGSQFVDVTFISSVSESVEAEFIKVNQKDKKSNGLAIFKCNIQNSQLVNLREEDIRIDINYYTGLRIPKKALRTIEAEVTTEDENGNKLTEKKQLQGVFIKRVKELLFKEVNILYSASNYVICDPEPWEGLTEYGTITLYDDVVVQGADLYDGKIVR